MNSKKKSMSQGARANVNGKIAEKMLIPLFEENDYMVISYGEYSKNQKKLKKMRDGKYKPRNPIKDFNELDKLIIKNYPYTSIYNHPGKTEYVIINKLNKAKERRIRVEVKWQQSAGSVDEKFPYIWLNAALAFEEEEVIIIIAGDGYKAGAREWMESQCEKGWLIGDKNKTIKIMSIEGFVKYFTDEMCQPNKARSNSRKNG